jgi:hypothetical protein
MPETDAADSFLRHRSAVLDAVLSNPALSNSGQREPVSPDADVGWEPRDGAVGENTRASDRIRELLDGGLSSGPAVDQPLFTDRAVRRRSVDPDDGSDLGLDGVLTLPDPPRARPRRFGRFGEQLRVLLRNRTALVLAACAVVVALLVVLLVTTGGDDAPQATTAPPATATAPASAPAAPPAPPAAVPVGAPIQVKSATTHCPAGSTDGMDAFSSEDGKAWSCVRAFNVDGQVMTIDLGKQYEIDSIGIVPGFDHIGADGTDEWVEHRTVSRVSYEFDDDNRTTYTQETMDQRTLVVTKVEPPIEASEIVLTVLKSNGSRSADDVAISSIVITGH